MKRAKLVDRPGFPLPGLPETVFVLVILLSFLFAFSAYFPLFSSPNYSIAPGSYITLNNTYESHNLFPENSIEVFKGFPLFYFHFPENTIHSNPDSISILSDSSILRDEIGMENPGKLLAFYPFPCKYSREGYAPQNFFQTKSALDLKEMQVICVETLFGNKKQAQLGIQEVSEDSVTFQVLSISED